MKIVDTADKKLEPYFKDAPKLSESGKTSMVKAWPWIALISGVLQIYASFGLWRLAHPSQTYGAYYESIYGKGAQVVSGGDKFFIYLGFLLLLVNGVILLLSYQKLAKKLRSGWDLLYLGALVNAGYALISLFITDRGFFHFLFSALASVVIFWLLYQVKNHYH